uniref:Amino acid transporter transmembrane domain-containing protein n=2 Tax=Timema TaxID=61471 RepID=A0A7R9HZ70_9NEOP|nr:unnamed protein product [Timema bartmani]
MDGGGSREKTEKKMDERCKGRHPEECDAGALAHLLKCSLGTGILAMPHAFRNAGIVFGFVITVLIGVVCTHCVHILVKSSHILCRRQKIPSLTYAQTAELAFLSGPPSLQRFSSLSRIFASVMMALTYFCSLCVYLVFIATSIKQLADHYYQEGTPEEDTLNIRFYILMLAPFVYALGMITNLKFLVPFSAAANLLMMTGFAITLYYMLTDIPPVENLPYIATADEIPIFFSTVIFAMEGIGVVMPLENSMKNPSHFLGCPGVLNTSMAIVIFMYTLVGLAGYLKYGDDTAASITLNLPIGEVLAQAVKFLIAAAILLSYGLQVFIPVDIVWTSLQGLVPERWKYVALYCFRVIVVSATIAVAVVVPNLGPAISLVGAICFSTLGLLTPAVIETATCWEHDLGRWNWLLWKNLFIIIFSLVALITGTYTSIIEIITAY